MENHTTLHALLTANARFALNGRGTTNHCPMVLTALAAMGASPARLGQAFRHWEETWALPAPEAAEPIAWEAWPAHAGRVDAFVALSRCFAGRASRVGESQLLLDVLGALPPAPASGAFHALLRIAAALESSHGGELAAGLAALVAGRLELPLGRAPRATSAGQGLARVSECLGGRAYAESWITAQLRAVAAEPDFVAALPAAPRGMPLCDALAPLALRLYWQSDDFTVLHLVTGTRAARLLLERLPAAWREPWEEALWAAFCAAYVTAGAPALLPLAPPDDAPGWDALLPRALAHDDDHVIKLAHACWREDARAPSPLYRAAVQRALIYNL